MFEDKWVDIVKKLDYALQPIVHTHSGKLFAVEALLRNVREAGGFYSIFNCFDEAYHDSVLYTLDLHLRKMAIKKFSKLDINSIQLFYNLDNRLPFMPDYKSGNTIQILEKLKLDKKNVCFEISERGSLENPNAITTMVNLYKESGFDIAIDDFGTGISGLKLLYYSEPNFIKLDRFFIQKIEKDQKKRHFCSSIINMAHKVGIKVIAVGIETESEYYVCKDLGADFVQGYFIQKPTTDINEIKKVYQKISDLVVDDSRNCNCNQIDQKYIDYIPPLKGNSTLHDLFTYFKDHSENTFVPLIDDNNKLLGVIFEEDIKKMSYSPYGLALAENSSTTVKVQHFFKKVTSVEVTWGVDKTLDIYNISEHSKKGVFVLSEGLYHGFINLNNLLLLSYNRNLEIAKNQNPLTKLPGNDKIEKFITESLVNDDTSHLVYFDFNDFKPFNDYYGFRLGDRAIILFSDILKKEFNSDVFIGHIGGDDFFVGFKNRKYEDVYEIILKIQNGFKDSAINFYSKKDIENGYIKMKDRFSISRKFSLLSVSSAIIEINKNIDKESLDQLLALAKKSSKVSTVPFGVCLL